MKRFSGSSIFQAMSRQVREVSDAEFKSAVLESDKPVLVDFTATWCPPCRAIKPALEELATQFQGQATIVAVDVDQSQQTSETYGIRAMPTLLMFKGGKVVGQLVGAAPKARFEEMIRKAL